MTYKDYLIESPKLLDCEHNFGMGDDEYNKSQTKTWLNKKVEDIESDDNHLLFRTGYDQNGYYVLYNELVYSE